MRKIDLTKGDVTKVLTALSLPIMGSSLLQFTYNIIDMLWVGRLGSSAVAAIGSSSFYIGLGYSINALVVIGCGIKTAHSIGKKDDKSVREYINSGIFVNSVISIVLALVFILLGKSLIGFLEINDYIVETKAYHYLAVSGIALIFTFFNALFTRILGSYGNNSLSFKINSIGLITNIILDPIFIYVLKMDVIGAAIATLIANIIMFIVYLSSSNGIFKYDLKSRIDLEKSKEIIKLGFPNSSQRILFTLINILIARIISKFGTDAIAAQKIALQIESITYMVIGGLHGAVSGFTGQNFGALKYDRVKQGYKSALKIGIIYSFIMAFIFIFLNRPLVRLFIKEEATIIIAGSYLKIVAFSQIFSTIETISNGLFTGIGRPKIPAVISIVFTALRIPMALAFIIPFGINGVWMSISLSSILKGIVSYSMYCICVKRKY